MSKFTANLPKNCVVVGAREVGGIIGETDTGCPVAENDFTPQLSLFFIPKAKGVNVDLFEMTGKEIEGDIAQWRAKLGHLENRDVKFLFLIGGNTTSADYMRNIWVNTDTVRLFIAGAPPSRAHCPPPVSYSPVLRPRAIHSSLAMTSRPIFTQITPFITPFGERK